MAKHDAKTSKRIFIISMIFAVLLSFSGGTATGFYYAKLKLTNANTRPIIQNTAAKTDDKKSEEKKLTKEEQAAQVKGSLKSYYDVNLAAFNKMVKDSLTESKIRKTSQDSIFKEKLIKTYEGIIANNFLTVMRDYIKEGSLQSDYYLEFFKDQEGSQIKSISVTEYKDNLLKAKITITNQRNYDNTQKNFPSAQEFLNDSEGKGITQEQYTKMLNLKPSKISVLETNSGDVTIEKISGKWYITSYAIDVVSSEISNVTVKGKLMKFADFVKTYLKK